MFPTTTRGAVHDSRLMVLLFRHLDGFDSCSRPASTHTCAVNKCIVLHARQITPPGIRPAEFPFIADAREAQDLSEAKFVSSTTGSRSDRPRTTFRIPQVPRHIRRLRLHSHRGRRRPVQVRDIQRLRRHTHMLAHSTGAPSLRHMQLWQHQRSQRPRQQFLLLGGMCAAELAG
jgi:hypothetical protein